MLQVRIHLLAVPLALLVGPAWGAELKLERKPAEIVRLIKQLGSEKFDERERASKELAGVGETALEPLRKAAASGDAEVRSRAAALVQAIEARLRAGDLAASKEGRVHALAFSPDSKWLASATNYHLQVWEVSTGTEHFRSSWEGAYAVAFSPDGRSLAAGMKDHTVRLWDPSTGNQRLKLPGHHEGVTAVAFSPDGRVLASGSYDGTIRFWGLPAGRHRRTIRGNEEGITGIAFSPDGKTLASGGIATTEVTINTNLAPITHADVVRLWDVATGMEVRKLEGRGSVVAFSSDGKTLATGGLTAVFALNRKPGELIDDETSPDARGGRILANEVGTGIQIAAVSIHAYPLVHLWGVTTGKELTGPELRKSRGVGSAVAFSPDGKLLAAGAGPVIELRSKRLGNLIGTQEGPDKASLWATSTGKLLRKFGGRASAVAFSPDGQTLAVGGAKAVITLWDVATLLEDRRVK